LRPYSNYGPSYYKKPFQRASPEAGFPRARAGARNGSTAGTLLRGTI